MNDSIPFFEYVQAEFTERVGYTGKDYFNYFCAHGMDKFSPETAEDLACQYAEQGAAVGAMYPDIMRSMFERTYAPVAEEKWAQAYAAVLDIGQARAP